MEVSRGQVGTGTAGGEVGVGNLLWSWVGGREEGMVLSPQLRAEWGQTLVLSWWD